MRRARSGSGNRFSMAAVATAVILAGVWAQPGLAAAPTPPFAQCPPIGADPSCALLIVVTDTATTVVGDPALGPYDGSDDTVVGILNNSSRGVGSLPLSSSSKPIFGFEGDGICSAAFDNGSGTSIPAPTGCPFGSTGYEGPNTSFSAISPDTMTGTVNFATPLAPGASAYFSLEETLLAADVTPGMPSTTPGGAATPTILTRASAAATVGSAISDTATVSGGSAPTGTISFDVFGPTDPACKATPLFHSAPVRVTGAGSYTSAGFTTSAPGTYRFVADYSGDANNAAASTGCADPTESVVVAKAAPTIATTAGPAIAAGGSTSDSATIAGGFKPTGTVVFKLYGPGDPSCARPAVATWIANINGNGTLTSGPVTLGLGGTYVWTATYSGDANNAGVAPVCGDAKEAVTVGVAIGQACGDLGTQVDGQVSGQSVTSDLNRGFSFNLNSSLSIGLRVVLRAKDPATGDFVSLANLLVHAAGPVTIASPGNGLGPNYARRAQRFLNARSQAGGDLVLFRIVHCRPDKQSVSAESIAIDNLHA